jgi:aryl-alcohol dehydrogenase-like predicted oxidoreductase
MAVEVDGEPLLTSVQATWNLFERSAEAALEAAAEAGWQVIVKEALANGRLTGRGDPDALLPLQVRAEQAGVDVDAVALAAACSRPWADTVLSGAATVDQLRSNVCATRVAVSCDDLEGWATMVEEPAAYWSRRADLPWR